MASIVEMAEAHLTNVQREIQNLTQRKGEIEAEIDRLQTYLMEGASTLEQAKSTQEVVPQRGPEADQFQHKGNATVFNPTQ